MKSSFRGDVGLTNKGLASLLYKACIGLASLSVTGAHKLQSARYTNELGETSPH
jgi:hypothetical protein